ncbi:MAG: hypothetical protein MI784_12965 [Cytophagales bacterium]|nr:hypothetical protein [Cytophagales bacterium]
MLKLIKKTGFTLIFFVGVLVSCSEEEEFKTAGELMGEKIQKISAEENAKVANVYLQISSSDGDIDWHKEFNQLSFQVEGQVIRIEDENSTYYNLDRLDRIEVKALDTEFGGKRNVLILYFSELY